MAVERKEERAPVGEGEEVLMYLVAKNTRLFRRARFDRVITM